MLRRQSRPVLVEGGGSILCAGKEVAGSSHGNLQANSAEAACSPADGGCGLGSGSLRSFCECCSDQPVDTAQVRSRYGPASGSFEAGADHLNESRHNPAEQITFENATLNDCIRFAYGVTSDAQIEAPDWVKSKGFLYNITGKAPSAVGHDQFAAMMKDLLAERFKLVIHREPREMSYFALALAKRGSQMPVVRSVPDGFQGRTWGGDINTITTMPMLAYLLSRFDTERPTIDETCLRGLYEVRLKWSPSNMAEGGEGTPLSTALQEQLGLRLERRKGPVDVWVIDAAQQIPLDN